jgi:DNA gyrase subunit A
MATNIPPHNLSEAVDAAIALLHEPELGVEDLMDFVPGPDFPTAGFILGRKGIHDAYTTGRGIVRMQARTRIREAEKKKRAAIIVSELPYQVNKARLVEQIANLVHNKRLRARGRAEQPLQADPDADHLWDQPPWGHQQPAKGFHPQGAFAALSRPPP